MKAHTSNFKEQIKKMGRELDSKITCILNGVNIELGKEHLNSITPTYQGSLLKSVMKELDIDSNIYIPTGTILNYQFGVKVNGEYEYINFGNYVVYSVEKQENTNSYKIICYDKMLYSMKNYDEVFENITITYPITIRDFLKKIATAIGLTFKNVSDEFDNYSKQITQELYKGQEYTIRDVLDELAQATASIICISDDDKLEIRYITETYDTIDEEFLKDVNVNFGEKYGPINSIVLSRSAETDNVYTSDETSIAENGLCELKIIDNQIMNFNDRSDYLQDIFNRLNGTYYYLNDFSSTGIAYYDLCDRYNVQVGDNTYSCVMLNDEINITQGLEENIYTERLKETETDYTKADKTDRKINQTYLIIDKQNQQITSVVSQVDEQNSKIATISQQVGELNSKITDISNITTNGETIYASFTLDNINQSEPIEVKIRPTGENISYLYPRDNLYPSDDLYLTTRTLRFKNTRTSEIFDYELPDDLLYYDSNNYDEFYLNYDSEACYITKKCGYNADGSVYLLDSPITNSYEYPKIYLTDGDYEISLLGYSNGYLYVRLMTANLYTTQFATKVELNSTISQTAEQINTEVSKKVGQNEIISRINQTAETITIEASKVNIGGVINAINNNTTTTIDGNKITTGSITADQIKSRTITADKVASSIITTSNLNAQKISCSQLSGGTISGQTISGGTISGSTITATRGTIGGWKLSSSYLYSSSSKVASYLYSNGNVILGGNYGLIKFDTNPVRITTADKLLLCDSYSGSSMSSTNDTISVRAFNGTIHINSNYGVYAGSNRIDGSSSRTIKTNIKPLDEEYINDIYKAVKKMPLYTYDYLEKYGDKDDFGFIIEDIENTCLKRTLKINQNPDNKLVKNYGVLELNKMNLVLIKELMKKIESLEEKLNVN